MLNKVFNEFAYEPPGAANSSLFGCLGRATPAIFNLQDAHGRSARAVLVPCLGYEMLEPVVAGNPQLGLLTRPSSCCLIGACPHNLPPTT